MKEKCVILWTTGDKGTSMNMVLMYAKNAMLRGWWSQVELVIWGASAMLVANDEDIQKEVEVCAEAGVEFRACQACARNYGVYDLLLNLNIKVVSYGPILTQYLKDEQTIITV